MEFTEVVRRRRMVRAYDPTRPVPPEVRDRILGNALHAPSAGFSQGWGFLVLEAAGDRELFWSVTTEADEAEEADSWLSGMSAAPLLIVCFSHKDAYLDRYAEPDKGWADRAESHWPVPYWDIDTGMAALLMLQTAVDEELGACFFGVPPEHIPGLRTVFGVPDGFAPIGVVSIGYRMPDQKSPSLRRGRRGADEVVHHGRW
ncbi:MAG: nitroreductase family protein [Geodermatophilaceae bacterium]|nr:nitroreductase family protein [Geodermatophilaceae bacterium]